MIDCLFVGKTIKYNCQAPIDIFLEQRYQETQFQNFFDSYIGFETLNTMTYLQNQGLNCHIVPSITSIENNLIQNGIHVVAIVSSYITSIHEYVKLVKYFRKYSPQTNIVVGGSFVKNLIDKLNENERKHILDVINADLYIVRYDCHIELASYVQRCIKNKSLANTPNTIEKLDREYSDLKKDYTISYHDYYPICWEQAPQILGEIVGLRATINCDFACAFCAIKDKSEPFTVVEIDKLEKDLRVLDSMKSVKTIFFIDETLNYPVEQYCNLLNKIIDMRLSLKWYAFFRCQYVNDEIAKLTRKSGCIAALLGAESGNTQLLERMNKQVTPQQLHEGIQSLKKVGIITFALFIVGFPGETEETINDTVDFINKSKPDFYVLNRWTCEEGTAVWKNRDLYHLECRNGVWKHDTMTHDQVPDVIKDMNQRIHNSSNVTSVDFSYIIQLLNRGYALHEIKNIIKEFHSSLEV